MGSSHNSIRFARKHGIKNAARATALTEDQIRYAIKKADEPSFHSGTHGGVRNVCFTPEERELVHQAIWDTVSEHPRYQLHEIVDAIDFDVNVQYVHKVCVSVWPSLIVFRY